MVVRKSFSGDREAAVELLGIGKNLLAQLRLSMQLNKLMVGQRTIDLDGGVRITVSSVFGQDEITIHAPPETAVPLIDEALDAANRDPEFLQREATNADVLTVGDVLTLTITVYDNIDINPGTGSGGGTNDIVIVNSSVRLTIVTTTYPPVYVPPPKPPEIFIGGYKHFGASSGLPDGHNEPFVWDDVRGLRMLGLRSTLFRDESSGEVLGISADGQVPVGSVAVRDTTVPPGATAQIGPQSRACAWRNGVNDSEVVAWTVGKKDAQSQALAINAAKTVVSGMWRNGAAAGFPTAFTWDGQNNHALSNASGVVGSFHPDSTNGRVHTSQNKYQLDGGPWISYGGGDCVATCAAHVPYTAPTPPNQTPTVKTTTLVFSG